jgi:predicted nucleic acid-binding protein
MDFVLDASVALSWCFVDEKTPLTNQLLDCLEKETAWVPSLWPLEIGNILIAAERRKRILYADMVQFLALLDKLSIKVDQETASKAFHETLLLAHVHKLTTYDASYLELAMRKGIPLATKDAALSRVAKQFGIQLLIP